MNGQAESALARVVADAGGIEAPLSATAQIGRVLVEELERGAEELTESRSGYDAPIVVAAAPGEARLIVTCPIDSRYSSDPRRAPDRGRLLTAAVVGALVDLGPARRFASADDLRVEAGSFGGRLAMAGPLDPGEEADAALLFPGAIQGQGPIDRLRLAGVALPAAVLARAGEFRRPLASTHPICLAEAVTLRGGQPASSDSFEEHEDAVLAMLQPQGLPPLPHDDPSPERRIARRILQRLDGLGKWGGYHTEFRHLARGFHGNDAGAALEVAERLVRIGFLKEKQSVGQRHVFLDPARSGDIRRAIERGEFPREAGFGGI